VRSFRVRGSRIPTVSIASSEHLALPRLQPGLREVGVYLGTFGAAARPLQARPVEGFGLDALESGAARAGLVGEQGT
jgi:hypothetical protein